MNSGAGRDPSDPVVADLAESTEPREAVVAGAGIAGLAAAIALRLAGWRVRVVERVEAVEPLGAGLLLAWKLEHVAEHVGDAMVAVEAEEHPLGAADLLSERVTQRDDFNVG